MLRILIRNILSNWVGFAVQAVVVFFLTPFIISTLGDARYGIWALVTGLTGYYGLLDLGFRSGITQYLARYLATDEFDELNRTASTACVVLACCGALIGAASLVIAWMAPSIFTIPMDAVAESRWCICVIGLSTAIQFAFFPFSAVFAAAQRYDLANLIGICIRLLTAAGIVVALHRGYGLVGLCAVQAIGEMGGSIARWLIAYQIIPRLRVVPSSATWDSLWAIANFGFWNFLIQNIVAVKDYSGIIIAGLFMPVAALAHFHLAIALTNYFHQFVGPIATVFFPAATQLDAEGDTDRLRTLYLAASKMLLLVAVPLSVIGWMWADEFYSLWVGPQFITGGEYTSVVLLFRILLVAGVVLTGQRIGGQILLATRNLRPLTIVALCETLAFLLLAFYLVRSMGLLGVVIATLLPSIVFRGLLQPVIACRLLGISLGAYVRAVYLRTSLTAIALIGPLAAVHQFGPSTQTWGTLVLTGIVAGAISLPILCLVGLDDKERRRLVVVPLKRALAKISRDNAQKCAG